MSEQATRSSAAGPHDAPASSAISTERAAGHASQAIDGAVKLSIRNLDFFYGTNKALKGIELNLPEKRVTGMIGPSGCGKSTLLNILSGLDPAYDGRVTIHGRTINEQIASGLRIAYVFQEPRLMPWRTIRGNIEFVLAAAGSPRAKWRERVDRCLALVELSAFAEFYPNALSGGMQQRASIARAFAIEPDILLMDEPFGALDELTARRLRQQLLDIWGVQRSTILFVSHNAFEATFLSDRVLIMSKGPGGRFCDEVDLRHLPRPRSYEDGRIFEQSKTVVETLIRHIGPLGPE